MLFGILITIAVVIVLFLIIVAMQAPQYTVVRSATISALPAAAFAQVNDFHNWQAWSPWAKRDPAAKNSYEGAPAGTGAIFRWAGNKQVGEGSMTITDSRPTDLIKIRLDFLKPFPSTGFAEFSFANQGDQTLVTWSMTARKIFITKAFCMFMNMDKMIGGDFEKGLAAMKTVLESPAQAPRDPDVETA